MSQLSVGQPAPPFRLPAAQGGEVGPADYRSRSNLIMFFAKGMACGFCRQKMSQLARGVPRFRSLDAEVIMITPTTLERGRFYARNFQLPYPYLCDQDYRVFELYGMPLRRRSLLWKAQAFTHAIRMAHPEATELGEAKPALSEMSRMLNDDDLGFFIADKDGALQYVSTGPYIQFEGARPTAMQPIPSTDEITAMLERAQDTMRRQPA